MEGNSGRTGGSLWRGCSKRGLTKPSSLVRELGNQAPGKELGFRVCLLDDLDAAGSSIW